MLTESSAPTAAFFDLDKTIIATSSTLAFSRSFYSGGLLSRGVLLRSAYAQFLFSFSGADHDQLERMRQYVSQMCAGWDVDQVRAIVAETLEELITPLVFREATALIAEHHAAGRDVIIVSASGFEVVEPIGAMLGADHVVATRMCVQDGHYTGEIDFYAYGPHKATAVASLAAERGYDLAGCYAYSDSATDLPMLEAVGHPFAVNPDRALRRAATEREWPVLDFTQPVTLRSKVSARIAVRRSLARHEQVISEPEVFVGVPAQRHPALAVGLGAGATAAAGLVWLATRRRERTVV